MDENGAPPSSPPKPWSPAWRRSTPARCAWPAAALLLAQTADAQVLNLEGPAAPAPRSSVLAKELTQRLTASAESLTAASGGPDRQALEAARREIRLAAADLAQLGDASGTGGSHLVLAAITIDRQLSELDVLLNAAGDRALLLALAHDLETIRRDWSRGESISPAQLDRDLRLAFAQLTLAANIQGPGSAGWILADSSPSGANLDDVLVRLGEAGVDSETLALLADDIERLELMRAWPGFVREAGVRSRLITEAAEVLSRLPAWLSDDTQARLVGDFASAVRSADPEARDLALELLAEQGAMIALLTEMGEGRQGDRLRSRLAQAISERSTSDADALAATRLALRTLETSEALSNLQRDEALLRQIRPAWRRLIPLVRDAMVSARDAAVNLAVDPSGVTNPGVLSAVGAQQRLRDDFRILEELSARFAPAEGTANRANEAIADRLLAIGQDMNEEGAELEPSLNLMRNLSDQLALWAEIDALREPASRVVGERADDLTQRLANLETQWLAGWGTPGGLGAGPDVAADLRILRDVMRAMADASAFTDLAALESWPGFEMDPQVRRLVTRELSSQIDALAAETFRGPSEISRQRTSSGLVTLRGSFGPALLAGRLARLAQEQSLAPSGPVEELALGPPVPGSWMAHHRDALADVSWAAAELARQLVSDPGEAQDATKELHAYLRWRALRTLEAIEREESIN